MMSHSEMMFAVTGEHQPPNQMSREITSHKVNPCNDKIGIFVTDEPGAGGANHRYEITDMEYNANASFKQPARQDCRLLLMFQNGPIPENGTNGVTQEVLLAIIIDRLKSFQAGPYSCKENSVALTHLETAELWLNKRTRERMARGVEGTHQK